MKGMDTDERNGYLPMIVCQWPKHKDRKRIIKLKIFLRRYIDNKYLYR